MREKILATAVIFGLFGSSFLEAQEAIEKHEIQPAPTVPDLSPQTLKALPKTFSVFDPQNSVPNELRSTGSDTSGTQAVQQSDPFSAPGNFSARRNNGLQERANGAADQTPALNSIRPQFGNELRPQPDDDDELPIIRPIGDSKLGFDSPPQAPAMHTRQTPQSRLPNQYDPNSGTSFPPVNSSPLVPQQDQNQSRQWNSQPNPRVDENIRPVNYQEPTQSDPNDSELKQQLVQQLLSRYDIDSAPDPLPGKPVRLVELLKTTPFNQRFQLVNKYWETYEEWALLINSAERLRWLNNNLRVNSPSDQALLEAARSSAANMIMESEIRLKESQAALQRLANLPGSDLLPLPSDQPLVKPFLTHFDYFVKRRQMPAILKSLDDTMPRTLQLIETRAQTVKMTRGVLDQNRNAVQSGQTTLGAVLTAVDLWNRSEVDLIRSVGKYNRSTTQYAFNFRPNQQNEALVKMLIGKKKKVDASSLPVSRTAQVPFSNPRSRQGLNGNSLRPSQTPRGSGTQIRPNNDFNLRPGSQPPTGGSETERNNRATPNFGGRQNFGETPNFGASQNPAGNSSGPPQIQSFEPNRQFDPPTQNGSPDQGQEKQFDPNAFGSGPSNGGFGR